MTLTSKAQRKIMGRFATGVTLVTTRDGEDIWCITANAVLSLSLDPALIMVAVDQGSRMHEHLTRAHMVEPPRVLAPELEIKEGVISGRVTNEVDGKATRLERIPEGAVFLGDRRDERWVHRQANRHFRFERI